MTPAAGGAAGSTRLAAPQVLAAGTRLLDFRIDGVLGSGRWGITYLATDVRLQARVVIKEYLPHEIAFRSADGNVGPSASHYRGRYQRGLEAFLRHARALAGLRHAALVRVVRFFEAQRTAYAVLEHVKGRSLKHWWPEHASGGEPALVALLRPLCEGLAVAHAAGVLHRDLRPDNVLVRDDGLPVLVDFHCAEVALAVALDSAAGAAAGFAPPELRAGSPPDPRSDLYALGATLYWCVAGRRPADADSRLRDPHAHVRAVEAARGRCGEPFLQAIDQALALDPARRPHDILRLRRTLLDDHAAADRPDSQLDARDTVIAGTEEPLPGTARLRRGPRSGPAHWPLPLKTALLAALAALLPALAAVGWLLHAGGQALEAAQAQQLQARAGALAVRVGQWLAAQRQVARQIGTDPDLVLMLARPDDPAMLVARDRLARWVAAHPDLAGLTLIGPDGVVLMATDPAREGRPAPEAALAAAALAGRTGGPGLAAEAPVLAQPLAGDDGQVLGALLVHLKPAALAGLLANEPSSSLQDAGVTMPAGATQAWVPVAGHAWMAGVQGRSQDPLQPWGLPLAGAAVLAALGAGAAGWRLGRGVVLPLADLTRAAAALAADDLKNATVPVRQRDEVGELAQTFNVAVDVLRQRERENERDRGG